MDRYLKQLIIDIDEAARNLSWPFLPQGEQSIFDWKTEEEERFTAPIRNLPAWTGIKPEMLPPENLLTDEQVTQVFDRLNELLSTCNCHVVFQTQVPLRAQYEAIRLNFDQDIKVLEWNYGFFAFCKQGTKSGSCSLGEYCQCAFFESIFAGFEEDNRTPEEVRADHLQFEIEYLRKKYDDDWMKYYPYHLDPEYDDEPGYRDYESDDDDEDKWWRR